MLQQTQVSRVVPKYEAFIKEFPTIGALANADRQAVLRQWQGLGYNSRAVRLHSLAKLIISEHGGRLPKSREELMRLPGIGPYTAGAMVIFSQRAPCASVDVNIERVIKRVFFSPHAQVQRKEIEELQLDLITRSKAPHHWHASIMDLGSAICTARNPACDACPLFAQCSTRGVRPDELRSAPKQSRFVNSTRWWRGQILKTVLPGPVPAKMLLYKIKPQPDGDDGERFSVALQAMIAEGIIERAGRNIRIAL